MSERPAALFLSPHLDDAVFSCGGTAARLSRCGWRVVVVTAFTASVPDPGGFALACQTDKGIPPQTDYMALRRAEDARSVRIAGGRPLWLDLLEAPHRGYESADELFAGVVAGDTVHEELLRSLGEIMRRLSPRLVFSPQAVGGHVDHLQVLRAVLGLRQTHPELKGRLLYYRDTPYAVRKAPECFGANNPAHLDADSLGEFGVGVGYALKIKLNACAAYSTQLGFQFGGESRMRSSLGNFAETEGVRLGLGGPAEAYHGTGGVRALLLDALSGMSE